jgi:hypothetical protein
MANLIHKILTKIAGMTNLELSIYLSALAIVTLGVGLPLAATVIFNTWKLFILSLSW